MSQPQPGRGDAAEHAEAATDPAISRAFADTPDQARELIEAAARDCQQDAALMKQQLANGSHPTTTDPSPPAYRQRWAYRASFDSLEVAQLCAEQIKKLPDCRAVAGLTTGSGHPLRATLLADAPTRLTEIETLVARHSGTTKGQTHGWTRFALAEQNDQSEQRTSASSVALQGLPPVSAARGDLTTYPVPPEAHATAAAQKAELLHSIHRSLYGPSGPQPGL